jgi:hypothetical protein
VSFCQPAGPQFSLATGKLGQGMYQGNVGEKGEAIIKMWDDQVRASLGSCDCQHVLQCSAALPSIPHRPLAAAAI